jgi:glutaminyl-peptide cyclotransferase
MHSQALRSIAAAIPLLFALGCGSGASIDAITGQQSVAEPTATAPDASRSRTSAFSADRAWQHLQAVTEIGARPIGSAGNERARRYLEDELEELGLEAESWEVAYTDAAPSGADSTERGAAAVPVTNLSAIIPGTQSADRLLLVAPFDTRLSDDFEFVGANDGASGAAVLLEMARVIASDPLPYATQIVFVDGEAPFSLQGTGRRYQGVGRSGLAARIQQAGVSGIRLMVFLNRVGDADLRIARDLMSERAYREEFWKAAADLERDYAFPSDAPFENAGVDHQQFSSVGFRRIVSIVDTRYGGDQPPGEYAGTADDTIEHCSPDSLETVGVVVLEALDSISQRLIKIDLFTGRSGASAVSAPFPGFDRESATITQDDVANDTERDAP